MSSYEFHNKLTGKKKPTLFIILIVQVLIVSLICLFFVMQIRKTTYNEAERYLSELSNSVSHSVSIQIKENLKELESISMSYSNVRQNGDSIMDYLQKKANLLDFKRVSVVSPDGSSIASDGFRFDFSAYPQIMSVFDGESIICNGIAEYSGTDNCFVYAVPVYEDGEIINVMVTTNTMEWLNSFTNQRYFVGAGFFHIFESNGSFVTRSGNQNTVLKGNNIFTALEETAMDNNNTVEKMMNDVRDGKEGYMYFTTQDNQQRMMFYLPIEGFENFYLSMMVIKNAATKQFDTLLFMAVAINIFIALMFISLIIILFFVYRRSNRELSTIAFVDPITGGYSRVRFEMEAEKLLRDSEPDEYSFITINISKFKLINDAFGNENGNKVLKYVHDTIARHIKSGEILCRTESDNFDLLVKTSTSSNILNMLDGISKDINAYNVGSDYKYYISITAGVYGIKETSLSIINIRDRANVARKNTNTANGNHLFSCVFFSDIEHRRQLREKEMENKMEASLKNGDFVVYLQPKVDTVSRSISGAEALVRWLDPERGVIPPNDFIPFFEKNGFIIKLDLYVFEQVCKTIRKWIDNGEKPIPVSVNLSRLHLNDPDFIEKYRSIQRKYDIPPELIEIELTETLVFENLEQIIRTVTKIHDSGFSCSLDDFGSGYSSLNMLKDINVDALKLDREFFSASSPDNPRERAIIASVVDMAKKLEMTTISEGVETMYQLEFLESIHCDMAQGFVISKPVPIDKFETIAFGSPVSENSEYAVSTEHRYR